MAYQETNLLLIFLDEPIPGKVNAFMAEELGEDEATRRYRAMIAVLLQQLEGLSDTTVRFCYSPDDAGEAISFWILPQLRGHVIKRGQTFLYTPERKAPAFNIEFSPQGDGAFEERVHRATEQAFADGYAKVASMEADCILCGSRWINAAFGQTKPGSCTVGPSGDDGHYLLATTEFHSSLYLNTGENMTTKAERAGLKTVHLPQLSKINSTANWDEAINDAIGGKLKAAMKKEV